MSILDRIKLALSGVGSNKFRSFLTLLGIIIGVSAVIIMVSLGSGTQNVIGGQLEGVMTRQIYLSPNWQLPYAQRKMLTLEDKVFLEEAVMGMKEALPVYSGHYSFKYNKREANSRVYGVSESILDVANLKLSYGRGITREDIENHEQVAVIGEFVLNDVLEDRDYSSVIGEEIVVDGKKFVVVGIMGISESVFVSHSSIHIPYTTYQDTWRRRVQAQGVSYYLLTYDKNTAEHDITAQVEYLLNRKYGKARGKSRFMIHGLQGEMDVTRRVIEVFTYVLGGIAAISLLVGGIGVMNIMLVTVKERTREIGIRKAIGASRPDIQQQFLFEAIILTVGGGLLGIIIGSGISMLINFGLKQAFDWWQGTIPMWIIMLSFGVTVAIGVMFGFYPAFKASKLDPIDALRYE